MAHELNCIVKNFTRQAAPGCPHERRCKLDFERLSLGKVLLMLECLAKGQPPLDSLGPLMLALPAAESVLNIPGLLLRTASNLAPDPTREGLTLRTDRCRSWLVEAAGLRTVALQDRLKSCFCVPCALDKSAPH